jgi:hypothetical protein
MVDFVRTKAYDFGTSRSEEQRLRDSKQYGPNINTTFSPLISMREMRWALQMNSRQTSK